MNNGRSEMNNKPLGVVLHEIKDDLKEFVQTRIEMLTGELRDKVNTWKLSLPMMLGALLLAWSAFLTLTFALVAALRPLFGEQWGWALAALVVGVFYLMVAGVVAWLAYRELKYAGVAPERTLRVLKQDQVWFQNEARQQL